MRNTDSAPEPLEFALQAEAPDPFAPALEELWGFWPAVVRHYTKDKLLARLKEIGGSNGAAPARLRELLDGARQYVVDSHGYTLRLDRYLIQAEHGPVVALEQGEAPQKTRALTRTEQRDAKVHEKIVQWAKERGME